MTFGHEFTGVMEDVGPEVENLKPGDAVLVPFNIACGQCHFCKQGLYGNCHDSNAQATAGGCGGGQADYVQVPYADWQPGLHGCSVPGG